MHVYILGFVVNIFDIFVIIIVMIDCIFCISIIFFSIIIIVSVPLILLIAVVVLRGADSVKLPRSKYLMGKPSASTSFVILTYSIFTSCIDVDF